MNLNILGIVLCVVMYLLPLFSSSLRYIFFNGFLMVVLCTVLWGAAVFITVITIKRFLLGVWPKFFFEIPAKTAIVDKKTGDIVRNMKWPYWGIIKWTTHGDEAKYVRVKYSPWFIVAEYGYRDVLFVAQIRFLGDFECLSKIKDKGISLTSRLDLEGKNLLGEVWCVFVGEVQDPVKIISAIRSSPTNKEIKEKLKNDYGVK